ncbi:MAG: hypothetical protein AAFV53_00320 [Myxococcota bacterium]
MGAELVWKNTRYAEWRGTGKSLGIGCIAVQISPRPRAGERIVVQAPLVSMVAGDRVVTVADVVLDVSPAVARQVALLLLKTYAAAAGRDELVIRGACGDR